jgi:ABC-type sugar transport system permease subunit
MTRIVEEQQNTTRRPRRKRRFLKASTIFVIVMLAYSVLHFLLMWVGVNFNSILLSFKSYNRNGTYSWLTGSRLFENFEMIFINIGKDVDNYRSMLFSSLAFFVVSCFVTLPISLFFSYFIFKKILANGFFKVIFFLPSIIPLIILTTIYSISVGSNGPVGQLLNAIGINSANLFLTHESSSWMIWIFCVWAGIGYDVILLTAGMSRIPRDILESCKMDGVPSFWEFIRIVIPLTWSTVTTLFIFGMMSVFTVFLQPWYLAPKVNTTWTIGTNIYFASKGGRALNAPAALGLFYSIIGAPIIVGVRALLNKFFGEVSY